jgi:hypothetical protein
LSCSTDDCDETSKTCKHASTGGCVVGGMWAPDGATNAANDCEVCDSTRASDAWSPSLTQSCQERADPDGDGYTSAKECPVGLMQCADTDRDGTLDYLDPDDDGDTVFTKYEHKNDGTDTDTDNDKIVDHLDPDDDGDSVPTRDEEPDPSGDGNPSDARNTDGDGAPDYLDPDDDNDGLPTLTEVGDVDTYGVSKDVDADGLVNWLDTDSDDDGIPDSVEGNRDLNDDGIPDYLQKPDPDAGVDAGSDASVGDGGTDAGDAGGPVQVMDAGRDGGVDANVPPDLPKPDSGMSDAAPNAGAGGDTRPDTGVYMSDSGSDTDPPDAAPRPDPLAGGGLAGGPARCTVSMPGTGSPDLSPWFLLCIWGLLLWRQRRD